jgi:nucleoside-diphosphate-sugar epimerase
VIPSSGADTVLVVGASGVIGSAAVDRFAASGWDVMAASRRRPVVDGAFRHVAVDLCDEPACADVFGRMTRMTHVVYAALYEKPGLIDGWRDEDQHDVNRQMLANVMAPLCRAAPVQHVSLLQGAKAYGGHLHPIPVPARERAPRDPHANFYWLQEDLLRKLAGQFGFQTTILRPQMVVGGATGVAMNLVPVIGAFAAVCRELGQPFAFPGGAPYVWEAVDARLVGEVLHWAATDPAAAGETFNVTNGDVFAWRDLWPALADELGVEVGPDEPRRLATWLPDHAAVWDDVLRRYELQPLPLDTLLGESHHYAGYCFRYGNSEPPPPKFLSTVKLRQAGFAPCYDTEDTFRFWLSELVRRGVLPPPA